MNPQCRRAARPLAADAFVGIVNIVNGVRQAVTGTVTRPSGVGIGLGSDVVYARVRDIGRLSFFSVSQLAGLAETRVPARR